MMITKSSLLPLLLCFAHCCCHAASITEKHLPLDSWISLQGAYYKIECDRQMTLAAPADQPRHALSGKDLFCNCGPAGLKAYAASLPLESREEPVSLSAFVNLLRPSVVAKCLATHLRSTIYANCLSAEFPLPAGATDRESFCQCVLTQFKTASETDIRNAADAAQQALDNAAEAMEKGSLNKLPGSNELITQILNKCSNQ